MVRGSPNPRHLGLPARLKKARKQSGLTRMAVAENSGLSSATELYAETGQRLPTVGTIARLASVLSVTAPWLAYGLGEPNNPDTAASCEGMAERLQASRTSCGYTRTELARLAELSPGTVAHIENGGQAKVQTIEALAKALGVSPGWLAFGVGPQVLPSRRRSRQQPQPAEPEP